jgi:hypothetical protein
VIAAVLALACARGIAQEPAPLAAGVALAWEGRSVGDDEFARWITVALGRGHEAVQAGMRHLLQIRLVETEAAARGWTAAPAQVDARLAEARAALEASGLDLEQELRARGLGIAEFRKLLGDSLLHERLARADLRLAEEAPVAPEQLQAWTDERLAALLAAPAPAAPDLLLDAGVHRLTRDEVGEILLRTLSGARLRELGGRMALEQGLPAWGAQSGRTLADAVLLEEIEWRRRRVAENPNYQGATYEGLLAARNTTLEEVLAGAELRVAGWLRLWSAELWPDAWFDALPAEEQRAIEEQHGAAREVHWLLLHAKEPKESELDLTPAEAEAELRSLAAEVRSLGDFAALAGKYSEHANSQRRGGRLGFVHRAEPGVDPLLLAAAFAAPIGALQGPAPVQGGRALLWVAAERPPPTRAQLRAEWRRAHYAEAESRFLERIGLRTRWDEPG